MCSCAHIQAYTQQTETLTLQNWKKRKATKWPREAEKLVLSLTFWFACSPPPPVLTVHTLHTLHTLHTPELDESRRGEVTPLISWCGTCPQTEPLILLIDSFAVFPYSCLLVVFVRGAELIHRLMEFGLEGLGKNTRGSLLWLWYRNKNPYHIYYISYSSKAVH